MDRVRRIAESLAAERGDSFGADFDANKRALAEVSVVRSKRLRNRIAGYITRSAVRKRRAAEEDRRREAEAAEERAREAEAAASAADPPAGAEGAGAGGAAED